MTYFNFQEKSYQSQYLINRMIRMVEWHVERERERGQKVTAG